jgi:hypothetical protein
MAFQGPFEKLSIETVISGEERKFIQDVLILREFEGHFKVLGDQEMARAIAAGHLKCLDEDEDWILTGNNRARTKSSVEKISMTERKKLYAAISEVGLNAAESKRLKGTKELVAIGWVINETNPDHELETWDRLVGRHASSMQLKSIKDKFRENGMAPPAVEQGGGAPGAHTSVIL